MIYWNKFDPHRVEQAVKVLLKRLHPDVQGIDGSGGDDGQDVRWENGPPGLTIFEVKSYTALLTSRQKTSIRKSLETAVKHNSDLRSWILILPKDPTPGELRWFNGVLAEKAPGVTIQWQGQDWLNDHFSANPDLRRFLEGEDYMLLERAREMNLEAAVMANGPSDFVERYRTLEERADELSPFWKFRMETELDGTKVLTVSEKYVGAAQADPVTWQLSVEFDPQDPLHEGVREQLDRVSVFGGRVIVPASNVVALDVNASIDTRRLVQGMLSAGGQGDVEISSASNSEGLPMTASLALLGPEPASTVLRELPVTFRTRHIGTSGITLEGSDASDCLQVRLRLTRVVDSAVGSELSFEFRSCEGRRPDEVLPVCDLLADAEQVPGARLALRVGPQRIGITEPHAGKLSGASWVKELRHLVQALSVLQDHCGQVFPIPASYTGEELAQWRGLARIAEGKRVQNDKTITATIDQGHIEDFLNSVGNERARIRAMTSLTFQVGTIEAEFKGAAVYCNSAYVSNRDDLLRFDDSESTAQAIFTAADGEEFYWELVSAADGNRDPGGTVVD